jgi:SAM-dependent methyltransferase
MLPRTYNSEEKYRLKKRTLEVQFFLGHLKSFLKYNSSAYSELNILEFGCGNGFQIPYFRELGKVTGTDIFIDRTKGGSSNSDMVECNISKAPFGDDRFDLIVSNHVIEHIRELDKAFKELKRIGKKDCIYAFSVPTNIWLLTSLPAQYLQKVRAAVKQIKVLFGHRHDDTGQERMIDRSSGADKKLSPLAMIFDKIIPHGHGRIRAFSECYHFFKIKSWRHLFEKNGFNVLSEKALLLYAPSEWPIIPILKVKEASQICSSVVFLMQKKFDHKGL